MARMVEVRTELESILVEQALTMARELGAVTDAAPDGRVPAIGEEAAIRLGREPTRRAPEAALQRQGNSAEREGLPAAPAPAAGVAASRTGRPGPRKPPPAGSPSGDARSAAAGAGWPPTSPTTGSAWTDSSARGRPGRPAWPRRAGRSESPRIAWGSSPASGSTTRRSAATTIAPPRSAVAARSPRRGPRPPRPRARSNPWPTA